MATSKWNIDLIKDMHKKGDEEADRVIERLFREGQLPAVNDALQSLIENDQKFDERESRLPDHVKTYLRNVTLPTWKQDRLIEIAQETFEDRGLLTFVILGCASLPEDYVLLDGTRVLGRTQQLEDHIQRRIWETAIFLLDTMRVGGLGEDGRGIRSAQRVRLMHAAVRHLLQTTDPDPSGPPPRNFSEVLIKHPWKQEEYGTPINQTAMAAGYLSFSYIVLKSFKKLGVFLTKEQETAWLHCWNVVGHVMGVDDRLLLDRPETMKQAKQLYDLIWKTYSLHPENSADVEDGRDLARALDNWMRGELKKTFLGIFLNDVPRTMTRFLIGKKRSDLLGIKLDWNDRILLKLIGLFASVRSVTRGKIYESIPLLDDGADMLSKYVLERVIYQDRRKKEGLFMMPEYLGKKWNVEHIVEEQKRRLSEEGKNSAGQRLGNR